MSGGRPQLPCNTPAWRFEAKDREVSSALNILDVGNQILDIAHQIQGRVSMSFQGARHKY